MKIKKVLQVIVGCNLLLFALVVMKGGHAMAATRTWTGGGGDHNMNTATNWSGNAVPGASDIASFDYAHVDSTAINNDIPSASFAAINFTGTPPGGNANDYNITGGTISLSGGITVDTGVPSINTTLTLTADQSFTLSSSIATGLHINTTAGSLSIGSHILTHTGGKQAAISTIKLSGAITGSGTIELNGTDLRTWFLGDNSSFTGHINAHSGNLIVSRGTGTELGAASATVAVMDGGALKLRTGHTYNQNISLIGAGYSFGGFSTLMVDAPDTSTTTTTISGNLTLNSDVWYCSDDPGDTTTITGVITGNHFISVPTNCPGILVNNASSNGASNPTGTINPVNPIVTVQQGDSQPTKGYLIGPPYTYIIDGIRGGLVVYPGGVLKGTGTVGGAIGISVYGTGIIAPGHSPGCLNVTGANGQNGGLNEWGVYQVEIGGTTACSDYDQLKVTGNVSLSYQANVGTLTTSFVNGFLPKKGSVFTIIDNDGSDAVAGTFQNLPEGATFTVSGVVFKISYVGGDGNDVTLTVLSSPASPDTGFTLIKANPLASMAATTVLSAGILVVARRTRKLSAR